MAGDLEIVNNASVTILGQGSAWTSIDAGGVNGLNDRVFEVMVGATLNVESLTITGDTLTSAARSSTSVRGLAISRIP